MDTLEVVPSIFDTEEAIRAVSERAKGLQGCW